MASFREFMSLPMGAGPSAYPTGIDELGNRAYRPVVGPDYRVVQQPPNRQSAVKGFFGALIDDPLGFAKDALSGAAQGVWQGVSAPGRAAAGEPVSYGDVAATGGMVSLPAALGKYDPAVANMGIKAYHGSPHDFDRFSMDKIGTGEGAQAYGHGLYFAEAEDVAKSYRSHNSGNAKFTYNGKPITDELKQSVAWYLDQNGGDKQAVIDQWRGMYKPEYFDGPTGKKEMKILEQMDYGKLKPGHMYEVNINADPADFLDWDAPLSEQPQRVRNALMPDPAKVEVVKPRGMDALTIRQALKLNEGAWADIDMVINNDRKLYDQAMDSARRAGVDIGDDFDPGEWLTNKYREYVSLMAPTDDASRMVRGREQELAAQGIPGIKYYDGVSRNAAEGTRNYVVFDDSLIDIIRKYGLAGAMLGFGYPQENQQ